MEKEKKHNGIWTIRYLQINVHIMVNENRDGKIIEAKWSRPPYASTRMISALSYQDEKMKENICKKMIRAAVALTTNRFRIEAIKEAIAIMTMNGYTMEGITKNLHEECMDENIAAQPIL